MLVEQLKKLISLIFKDIWLPFPDSLSKNVPPHLAHLLPVDSLVINLRIDLIDEIIGWEMPNCFTITDGNAKHIYYATESSDCMNMFCFGGDRHVVLHVFNNMHEEVIRLIRPISCSCFRLCCPLVSTANNCYDLYLIIFLPKF